MYSCHCAVKMEKRKINTICQGHEVNDDAQDSVNNKKSKLMMPAMNNWERIDRKWEKSEAEEEVIVLLQYFCNLFWKEFQGLTFIS